MPLVPTDLHAQNAVEFVALRGLQRSGILEVWAEEQGLGALLDVLRVIERLLDSDDRDSLKCFCHHHVPS